MKKLAILTCALGLCVAAEGASIFDEQFNSPTLDPAWSVQAGAGSFSLTANPGFLRNSLDASTHPTGDPAAEWVYRSFIGEQWVLDSKATYSVDPGNGRQLFVHLVLGGIGNLGIDEVLWFRTHDVGGGSIIGNTLENGVSGTGSQTATNLADTYWLRIVRDFQTLTLFRSDEGITYNPLVSRTFADPLPTDQTIILNGRQFAAGQFAQADYDFITVDDTVPEPGSAALACLGLPRHSRLLGKEKVSAQGPSDTAAVVFVGGCRQPSLIDYRPPDPVEGPYPHARRRRLPRQPRTLN